MGSNNRFLLLAVLALFACVQATEMTSQMKQESLMLVQMETGYVVDDVLVLLKSFETDISTQISELTENVRIETEYVKNVIETLTLEKNLKEIECRSADSEIETVTEEVTKVTKFIEWITSKITTNTEKIEDYNKKSCEQTLAFVEYIRNAHNTLNLVAFLRKGVTNYSFTQMKTLVSILSKMEQQNKSMTSTEALQVMLVSMTTAISEVDASQYQVGDSLNDQAKSRTADEIGSRHVDNSKGNLDLEGYSGNHKFGLEATKTELFKILDLLEKQVSDSINERINSQIAVSTSTADFITYLEHENESLQKELTVQTVILTELVARLEIVKGKSDACHAEVEALVKKIVETSEQHEKYIHEKSEYLKNLRSQLEQLQAIIKIYEEKIFTAGSNLKGRYDDLVDNQTVDYTAQVDDRELTLGYDNLREAADLEDKVEGQVVATDVDQADVA